MYFHFELLFLNLYYISEGNIVLFTALHLSDDFKLLCTFRLKSAYGKFIYVETIRTQRQFKVFYNGIKKIHYIHILKNLKDN